MVNDLKIKKLKMSDAGFTSLVIILCLFDVFPISDQTSPGYVFERNNYIYKFVFPEDDKRTWYEAETLCQTAENGHLTSLVSPSEITWVDSVIKNVVPSRGTKVKLWIGGSDRNVNDVWDFVDGQPLRYNVVPWAPGQPKRPQQHVNYEFCVSLEFQGERSVWFVDDCFEANGYICKSDEPAERLTEKRFGYSWEWKQHIYKFIPLPWAGLSWTEAEKYCEQIEGGHLLSIRTRKESRWVTERIRQIRQIIGFSKFWIGASDFGHEGTFQWSDDTNNRPINFTSWATGEPSVHNTNNLREDCVAIQADPEWGKWSDERCVIATPFICKTRVCSGKADLAFILDSSSVSESEFQEAKRFVWSVIENFHVSANGTRVGFIRSSAIASVIFDLQFSADNNILRLKEMVDNIVFAEGGSTKQELALQLARVNLFSANGGSRPDVPKVLIVLTKGKSQNILAVARSSMALKRNNVTIVVVGIGEEVNIEELLTMASTAGDMTRLNTFRELKTLVSTMKNKVCDEMIKNIQSTAPQN